MLRLQLWAAIGVLTFFRLTNGMEERMYLTWPKPAAIYLLKEQGEETSDGISSKNPVDYCFDKEVPADVKRIPVPITGGRLQFNRTGTPWIDTNPQIPRSTQGGWTMTAQIGQIQGLSDVPDDAYDVVANTFWDMIEYKIGTFCDDPIDNITTVQTGYRDHVYPISEHQLDGLEVTLSVSTANFAPEGVSNNSEARTIIAQCAFIKFTSREVVDTPCKPEVSASPSTTSIIPSTTSIIPSPTTVPPTKPPEFSGQHRSFLLPVLSGLSAVILFLMILMAVAYYRSHRDDQRRHQWVGYFLRQTEQVTVSPKKSPPSVSKN